MTDYALVPALIPSDTLSQRALKLYLLSRSAGVSRKMAVSVLNRIARLLGYADMVACPWCEIEDTAWSTLIDQLLQEIEPEGVNAYIGTLRGLAHKAVKKRVGSADTWRAMADIETVPCEGDDLAVGRKITPHEMDLLTAACGDNEKGVRDRFFLRFLWATGLRCGSVAKLELSQVAVEEVEEIDATGEAVKVRRGRVSLKRAARGKRRKNHSVPLDATTVKAFEEYLAVRGDWAGPLFVRSTPGRPPHVLTRVALTYTGLSDIVEKTCVAAGIERVTAHDFRRTAITEWITVGGLRAAQLLADHSRPEQTAKYDQDGPQRMEETVRLRPVPGVSVRPADNDTNGGENAKTA